MLAEMDRAFQLPTSVMDMKIAQAVKTRKAAVSLQLKTKQNVRYLESKLYSSLYVT